MAVFRVLGAVAVENDGVPVDVGPASRRALLAVLLVEAGRVVSTDQLLHRLWPDSPPHNARRNLYSYLSRLRTALGGDGVLERRSGGYVLSVDPMRVDMHRFRNLVIRARQATDDAEAAELFASALDLWRGDAFEDLDVPWLQAVAGVLAAERLAAELDHDDVRLRRGRHGELLPVLQERAAVHPFDERVAGQLMLASYRSGRQSQALDHFRELRERLVSQLGSEPGPELSRLHRRILGRDASLDLVPATGAARSVVPRQLPTPPGGFVGRFADLGFLDDVVADGHRLAVLTGAGGMGKTWLAVHWAQTQRERFPDGQLFLDLRGFDPHEEPVAPKVAIRDLLAAWGIPPRSMPVGLDAQAGLFRSLSADKRVLVVLDNARDTRQVSPLLPGGAGSLTVVTSRSDLTGLVTAHGARRRGLRPLDDRDARDMLRQRVGHTRIAAEPEATDELLTHCAGLPLALGILGVRAALWPELPLGTLTAELNRARLDALDSGELSVGVRAVLDTSIAVASPEAVHVWLLLGIAPGADISPAAVASVAAIPESTAAALLRELTSAHLVDQPAPGRFRMHDLTRLYAAERAAADLPRDAREAALLRLTDHYLHTAFAGERLISPHRPVITLDDPAVGTVHSTFADEDEVHRWFDAELANLTAIQRLAASHHRYDRVWRIAWSMESYLYSRALMHLSAGFWRPAVEGMAHVADPAIEIVCRRRLAVGLAFTHRVDEATEHYRRALELCRVTGDREQEGFVHRGLTVMHTTHGDYARAVSHGERALRLFRELGVALREAESLNNLACGHLGLGDLGRARVHAEAALDIARRLDHSGMLGFVHSTLGDIAHAEERHETALEHYRLSVERFGSDEDLDRVDVIESIGDVLRDLGRDDEAREHWLEARDMLRRQRRDDRADALTTKLATSDTAPPTT
ncbi:DNA-binding SARP family transcriptional activator [Stackebrandtia albiflava]|uniref:DNA-binding SARP family transcriptional activator n=1 Tax=Stackebrandtia albiflava TaxID=406432 RepID=A0A562UQF7_9ACTN|nr:BTAD domain-containing putative transcriptional regulator [Stackebrandtia albiflava]TWJ07836.1 DNA-binding SARP family transcriptional activator [Stackebrandtia albiflava]